MEQEDRFSNLPITILHDILSRRATIHAARTSVLSKAWAETWSTFPNLLFSDTNIIGKKKSDQNFIESEGYLSKKNKFLDYVDKTLLRFRSQGLLIKKFMLSVKCFDLHNLSKDVDLWLKLVSESGVEVLELWQPLDVLKEEDVNAKCYILPTCVLEAKSLTKLVLKRKIGVDHVSSIDRSIKFFSLQNLYLERVLFRDEQALKHLISCCPLIEYITLKFCYVLKSGGSGEWRLHKSDSSCIKSVCLCGLSRLKKLVLRIQEVCVDSPCLEHLDYIPGNFNTPFKLDYDKCKNLRQLYLWFLKSTIITSKWFHELFAKCPFLDTVRLVRCRMNERIDISSVRLKILSLKSCPNLKEVNIDAPNLLSCHYEGYHAENSISFQRYSSQLNVNAMIRIYNMNFNNLGKLIQNFKSLTILTSVSLRIYEVTDALDEPVGIHVPSFPPSVKHLDLSILPKYEALYSELLCKLFSSCCPTTISVHMRNCCRKFIEFLYETLMDRDESGCFCDSCHNGHSKCWLHRLKDVKLNSPMNVVKKVDFMNMLDKLENSPYHPRNIISFELEF